MKVLMKFCSNDVLIFIDVLQANYGTAPPHNIVPSQYWDGSRHVWPEKICPRPKSNNSIHDKVI